MIQYQVPLPNAQRGTVMLLTIVAMTLIGLLITALLFQLKTQAMTIAYQDDQHQARQAAISGIQTAMRAIELNHDSPALMLDQPQWFANQLVIDQGQRQWMFSVYAANHDDPTQIRYAITDANARIDLNHADEQILRQLPGLSEEQLDALLDYRDADNDPRPQGAEQTTYDQFATTCIVRNGPLESVEELLRVHLFNPAIVYGEDVNQSLILDPNEDDGDKRFPQDNADNLLDRGLLGLCTVHSAARQLNADGQPKINLNGTVNDIQKAKLPNEIIDFITTARQQNHTFKHPADLIGITVTTTDNPTPRRKRPRRTQPRDDMTADTDDQQTTRESPVNAENLDRVLDQFTTTPATRRFAVAHGLINVYSAPATVLATVPGIGPDNAQRIVDTRTNQTDSTIAWLLRENILNIDQFKMAAPHLTTRTDRFIVRAVGFGVPNGGFCVLQAVIDTTQGKPRILELRNLTRFGQPFDLTQEQQLIDN